MKRELFRYAVAASTQGLIHRADQDEVEALEQKGYPLGAVENADFKTHETMFKHGDSLMLYSDALIETPNKENNVFSAKHLREQFKKGLSEHSSSGAFFDHFVKQFYSSYAERLNDDLSIIICHARQQK